TSSDSPCFLPHTPSTSFPTLSLHDALPIWRDPVRRSRCPFCAPRSRSSRRWRPSIPPESPIPAAEVRGLAAAVAFLTRVPVGRFIELDAADVARGGALFPLVGAGIGTVIGGIAQGLAQPLTARPP